MALSPQGRPVCLSSSARLTLLCNRISGCTFFIKQSLSYFSQMPEGLAFRSDELRVLRAGVSCER